MFALLINASILILAAATFNKGGQTDVAELEQAHSFLHRCWAPPSRRRCSASRSCAAG